MMKQIVLLLVALTLGSPRSASADTTAPLEATPGPATSVTYRVGVDSNYPTIESALAAATDPSVDKYIILEPKTYSYPLDRHTRLRLTTPRTHLRGSGMSKTKIVASSGKGLNSYGVIEVRASNCSVEGIWVENRWKKGDPPNKQSALTVGTGEDPAVEPDAKTTVTGVRINGCKMTATTNDRHSDNLAWDVVTVGANVDGCVFENCVMSGFADTFSSWAQFVEVKNSVIHAKGWNAIWVAGGRNSLGFRQQSVAVFDNCRLGSSHYYVAGGSGPDNWAIPVVYLKNCRPFPDTADPVEIARMQDLSHALTLVVRNTPFVPYLAVKGGPRGNPPSSVLPDVLFQPDVQKLFQR